MDAGGPRILASSPVVPGLNLTGDLPFPASRLTARDVSAPRASAYPPPIATGGVKVTDAEKASIAEVVRALGER